LVVYSVLWAKAGQPTALRGGGVGTLGGVGGVGGVGVALAGRRWGGVMGAKEAIVDRGMPPAEYIAARLRGVEAVRP
jgi:hypothetical protein